jgi:hypothetical protein
MSRLRIEILSFEGCPNADAACEIVREAARFEGVNAEIESVEVATSDLAERLRFLGSPSVRVEGEDVEPSADTRTAYGLMCRTYNHGTDVSGVPPIAMVREAIRRHVRTRKSRDILSNRLTTGVLYWLPALAIVASAFFEIGQGWRTAVWVAALATMGAACVANALRCARIHCYFTGPFFLVMAIIALLYGLAGVPLGPQGWNFIGIVVLVGAITLWYLPEILFGKYGRPSAKRS